jgi:hypothetical protein
MIGPRGLGQRVLETMPGGFDLGFGRAVAASPRFCAGSCVFGNLKPNNSARLATKHAILFTGGGAGYQSKASRQETQ